MKRLNPETGKYYKHGDTREQDPKGEDRVMFRGYFNSKDKDGFFHESWITPSAFYKLQVKTKLEKREKKKTPTGRAKHMLDNCKNSAKKRHIVFDIVLADILPAIERGVCQLTGIPFDLTPHKEKVKNPYAPSVDRIDNDKGYVRGNIRVVLWLVNSALGECSDEEALPVLKQMVKAIEKNVKQKSITSVPAGSNQQGELYPELGPFSSSWPWQDDDNAYHHCGTISREDLDHRAQASSGNSLARGSQEVEPLAALTRIEDHGEPDAEIVRLEFGRRYLSD